MRRILYLIVFLVISNTAYGSKTVSGVVAVSTGPMQAYTQSIGRDLAAGDDVFLNDEVETGETTRAQVLLRDESVFSLAPSSKVLFDEFVYDPMAGEGVLEASLLSGGMRFVSGQLSKNQPENIKIKAGKATVGIRGTEIMAKHGAQGTTFVLLSGAMEIATESGRQLIDRSGFGIDISNDGLLGVVRQVPLAEINAILAPPPKKEKGKSGDGEASSDENGEESAEAEEEGEDTASESEGESDSEGEAEASADASSETESESQETAASDSASAQSDSTSDDESPFDAALTSSVSSSEGETEVTVAGLSDMAAPSADNASADATAGLPQAETVETVTIDIAGDVLESVVSSLAEDDQKEQAEEVITQLLQPNISLKLSSQAALTEKPYYSSSGSLLVRSSVDFRDYPDGKFDVTHALLREKFPDSFDANGIMHHATPQSSTSNLSDYDAIFVYFDSDVSGEAFNGSEEAAYRDFIHSDNRKVLMIGDQKENLSNTGSGDFPTINSAMGIYNQNAPNGSEYTAAALQTPMARDLSPANETSELLDGVASFEQYYDGDFKSFNFIHGGVGTNANVVAAVDNQLLTSSNNDMAALDFGVKGAVFFGRWTCAANTSINGGLGASILPNSVSNGREQFCRNLISSIAPDNTLVDVEVGTLSVSGETGAASYRLISDHADEFSIIGDKLILNGGADLNPGTYDLVLGVTMEGGNETTQTLSLDVEGGIAEKRHIATRDTYRIGETVSFPTENLVTDTGYLVHATKNNTNNVSWVSVGSVTGGGTPSNTGVITLHYRIKENGGTYDRFHEIDIVHDCTSDHCEAFATSMDTANDLGFGSDFDASDRSTWASFFQRFSEGVGRFANSRTIQSGNLTGNYAHDLSVNFGTASASLNTDGTVNGATIDNVWNFDVVGSGPCDASLCTLEHAETTELPYDLTVNLMNIALPNGKHSMMIKTELEKGTGSFTADYVPMTPQ